MSSIVLAFVAPVLAGVTAHYWFLVALHGRRPHLCEIGGWLVTFAAAILLFPKGWRGLEFFTLAAMLWSALMQALLCVCFQPLARRIYQWRLRRHASRSG
jgi:Na+/proline symporter